MTSQLFVLVLLLACTAYSVPSIPYYYTEQLVDHFSFSTKTFSQRFYKNDTFFAGPNSPIFVILGGEGNISPETGIYYPWILVLAQKFGALVVEPEHRFYGDSQPFRTWSPDNLSLLTAQQALADTARFILYIKDAYDSPYSPVLTIGGSYPGWLSAMMRLRYPAIVDFAYAASAPVLFYSQDVEEYEYYRVVTKSAEMAWPGCSASVSAMSTTLGASASKSEIIQKLNLCTPLPDYLEKGDLQLLIEEVSMIVMYTFADLNMENYPPPNTTLQAACIGIDGLVKQGKNWEALQGFLNGYAGPTPLKRDQQQAQCFNLTLQLPAGPNATISAGDWSGVGSGINGANWDFETCTLLVERIGTNGMSDMFLPRKWTMEWLKQHCESRFGVTPEPRALADLWGFGNISSHKSITHIIFTNGLKDGWSVGGIARSIPDQEIVAINMPNGAHHSDLSHVLYPNDTPDVKAAHAEAQGIVGRWLKRFDWGEKVKRLEKK